jgi:hypothetical protein
MRIILLALAALTLTLPVVAQEDPIPLPKPRPVETTQPATPPADTKPAEPEAPEPAKPEAVAAPEEPTTPLPRPRPDPNSTKPEAVPTDAPTEAGEKPADPTEHIEPDAKPSEPPEPPRIYQSACPAVISGQVEATMQPPIADGQCFAQSPLALTGVMANGRMVPVSGGVTTSCGMASTLPAWVASIDNYLFAKENARIAEVVVGTSYMCRNVNNAKTGNLSFHAFADAVDVVGFKLDDGRMVTVEGGWSDALSNDGRLLRFAHDSACSMFTTTLGPEANALHHDHLHLDMGCHGGRCVARLCE